MPCGPLRATGTGQPPEDSDWLCGLPQGPAHLDLYFYQGDTERRTIVWESPPGTPAANLTNAAISMQIRNGEADNWPEVLCEISVSDGVTITDGAAATFEICFTPAKTLLLTGREPFLYDLQVTPSGGDTKTILRGNIYYDLERTR